MGFEEVEALKNFLYIGGLTECDLPDVALPPNFYSKKEMSRS